MPRLEFLKFLETLRAKADPCTGAKEQARLWRLMYMKERAKYEWPKHVSISHESQKCLKFGHIEKMKQDIALSGLAFILGPVTKIRIMADPIPEMPNEGGATYLNEGQKGIMRITDMHFMPDWRFPSSVLHEATHVWQIQNGLPYYTKGAEAQAYYVEEMFRLKTECGNYKIFDNNPAAYQAMQ